MSAKSQNLAQEVEQPDEHDTRVFPAEDAFSPIREEPAWKRTEPALSAGYIEVHRALCGEVPIGHEEVTSS